jgi:hypothetical protein
MKKKLTTEEMGKYLVLRLSFSGVSDDGDVKVNFRKNINRAAKLFSDKYYKAGLLERPVEIDPNSELDTLQDLFGVVELSGRKIYLIVDECDAFVNRLLLSVDTSQPDLGRQQYELVVSGKESMLRNWGNVIKEGTVRTIARAFFTGVAPQAFSDGLSSLNMVKDLTFSPKFEGLFGLTEDDVSRGLDMITHLTAEQRAQHLEQMRAQYDGYRFVPTQKEPLFNSQYVLYYLDHLEEHGAPPAQLIDPAVNEGTDNVAQFLISNYQAGAPYSPLDFLLDITSPEEMGTFLAEVTPAFRSKDLFQANTVSKSLVSLAFFHGFLTYKSDKDQRSVLTSPNLVMQSVYARALFAGLPTQWLEQLEAMFYSGKPDRKEFTRLARLGYDEAVKAGGNTFGGAAMKALVDRLLQIG